MIVARERAPLKAKRARSRRIEARLEGLLLDPVYTGKAMAGLLDLCERPVFGSGDNVLFVHTGGDPSLFAYQSVLLDSEHSGAGAAAGAGRHA